jgi:hypothetical protein
VRDSGELRRGENKGETDRSLGLEGFVILRARKARHDHSATTGLGLFEL